MLSEIKQAQKHENFPSVIRESGTWQDVRLGRESQGTWGATQFHLEMNKFWTLLHSMVILFDNTALLY